MSITYQKSGINYNLMDQFKNACVKAGNNAPQLIEFPDCYLVDVLEALGSLGKLADDIYRLTGKDYYYQVGWGNAATIINDLISVGATPLTLKLFVAAGNEKWFEDKKRWKNLINGFKDAAKHSNALWNGGETQTLVGIISSGSSVLAGSSTGVIKPKYRLIDENNIRENDTIIFFESSGIHTNGITLVRKLFQDDHKNLTKAIDKKTIIYAPLMSKILKNNIKIHFASHITGHGWRKIMRAKKNFVYKIDKISNPPEIFEIIQRKAKLTDLQMYSDFNMGVGYAIFISQKDARDVLSIARKMKIRAFIAGKVESGERKVVINPLNIVFEGKTLKIR
jgi:phosphoribosylformylglycinamidine cyclo-ligase